MENKEYKKYWEYLKTRLEEQLEDCRKHRGCSGNWKAVSAAYRSVQRMMRHLESCEDGKLIPFNGVWHTKEEIDEMLNSTDE